YSPAVSGIALNFNRVHFEWARSGSGYAVSMDAPAGEYRPAVAMAKMQVVRRSLPIYTYEAGERLDSWTVASGALGGGGSRWLPVRLPGLYAGDVFQTLMRAHGIALGRVEVVRDAPQGARELARHESEPLRDILRDMLKYSTNITAEMVGMSATAARAGIPASLAASAAEMNAWAVERFGMQAPAMVDHSGLGPASRLSPQDLVRALVAVHGDGTLRSLMKPFLMRDAAGRVMTTHPIKVDAKTGTLNFVSGLGGYMTAADGTQLAFAIFTADLDMRARIPRAQRERPDGARSWNRRAKGLQQALIERWGALYGS
ncbi:D-alanyl-D-alanine carboxypeptidase, partial [Cribrihabitans sp. XS_ASV171]